MASREIDPVQTAVTTPCHWIPALDLLTLVQAVTGSLPPPCAATR